MKQLRSLFAFHIFMVSVYTSTSQAQIEIQLLPESKDYADSVHPLTDEIYQGHFDADAETPVVIGKPLDLANLRDNLPLIDEGFPSALYAGFLATVLESADSSDTYRVSAMLTPFLGGDGMNGIHFQLTRDINFSAVKGIFRAAAAFPLPELLPIERLAAASVRKGGFGSVTWIIVGNSEAGKWWISTREDSPMGSSLSELKNSVWRVLDPDTLEAGEEDRPASFDIAGVLLQQTPDVNESLNRPAPGNTGLVQFSITIDEQ